MFYLVSGIHVSPTGQDVTALVPIGLSTSGDSRGNPPHEQLWVLYSWDIYCVDADGALFDTALLSVVFAFSHYVIAPVPIGLKYMFCLTTSVANETSLKDCIEYCLVSEALMETLEETYLTSSFGFCIVGCATTMCSRLSSQGTVPELAGCVNTCVERCTMKN
ncbi:hypothetical protein PVK06_016425 [Gossypium arboreum]|uniref:Uncharacterized protein n=1 Tax=Gossypium arboreum TaxID=29729 RepID=A0ABR0Q0U7_GOSAR|nr:hypothetical protein PVK06_016425 [Gossypium arboreum]